MAEESSKMKRGSGSVRKRVMRKKVLGDDFGITIECWTIDSRDKCWISPPAMKSIWFWKRERCVLSVWFDLCILF